MCAYRSALLGLAAVVALTLAAGDAAFSQKLFSRGVSSNVAAKKPTRMRANMGFFLLPPAAAKSRGGDHQITILNRVEVVSGSWQPLDMPAAAQGDGTRPKARRGTPYCPQADVFQEHNLKKRVASL